MNFTTETFALVKKASVGWRLTSDYNELKSEANFNEKERTKIRNAINSVMTFVGEGKVLRWNYRTMEQRRDLSMFLGLKERCK